MSGRGYSDHVSRRNFVACGVGVGAGILAGKSNAGTLSLAGLNGPCLDLMSFGGNRAGLMRLKAASTPDKPRYGWFLGRISIVSPHGVLRPICGVRGIEISCLRDIEGDLSISRVELGAFCDLVSGTPLTQMKNPLTGETVRPPRMRIEWDQPLTDYRSTEQKWRVDGDRLLFDEDLGSNKRKVLTAIGLVEARVLTQCFEHVSYTASLAEMQHSDRAIIGYSARSIRFLPPLSWLNMDSGLGSCIFERDIISGFETPHAMPSYLVSESLPFA